jgi:hypothetical protein
MTKKSRAKAPAPPTVVSAKAAAPSTSPAPAPAPAAAPLWKIPPLVPWLLALPRPARLGIVVAFSLALSLAIFPLVDQVYLTFSQTYSLLPSFVSMLLGGAMYVVGWRYLVGTAGEPPAPSFIAFVYFIIGILALVVVFALLLQGVVSLNTPA